MASIGAGHLNPDSLLAQVRAGGLLNKVLSAICKAEGLPHAGVKAELQNRICENIRIYAASGDVAKFERLKAMLFDPKMIPEQLPGPRYNNHSSASPAASPRAPGHGYNGFSMGGMNGFRSGLHFDFKPTPFYKVQRQLGDTKICDSEYSFS